MNKQTYELKMKQLNELLTQAEEKQAFLMVLKIRRIIQLLKRGYEANTIKGATNV